LRATVDLMTPNGNTNVTIGLVWGWHALTSNAPFTTGAAPAADLDKVIILLTDGDNTKNRWTINSSSIDARTQLACDNIKAANLKIYTVRVIAGNATLLRGCATNPGMYYDVQQASQLNTVQRHRAEFGQSAAGEIARVNSAQISPLQPRRD
jgi:von Willebrand factor type A domain-containing protein